MNQQNPKMSKYTRSSFLIILQIIIVNFNIQCMTNVHYQIHNEGFELTHSFSISMNKGTRE